jgi:hypothetical protein
MAIVVPIAALISGKRSPGLGHGQRLTPYTPEVGNSVYFGKDSAIFMEEVIAWLIKSGK